MFATDPFSSRVKFDPAGAGDALVASTPTNGAGKKMLGRYVPEDVFEGTDQGPTSGAPPLGSSKLQCHRISNVNVPDAASARTAYLAVVR